MERLHLLVRATFFSSKSLHPTDELSYRPGPRPHLPFPLFSFTKTSVHADLLVPFISNDYFIEIGRDPVWESKKHNKVLWRGDTVGAYHAKGTGWRQTQRPRLVKRACSPSRDYSLLALIVLWLP